MLLEVQTLLWHLVGHQLCCSEKIAHARPRPLCAIYAPFFIQPHSTKSELYDTLMVSLTDLSHLNEALVKWEKASEIYLEKKDITSKNVNRTEEKQLVDAKKELETYFLVNSTTQPLRRAQISLMRLKSDRLNMIREELPKVTAKLNALEKKLDANRAAEAKSVKDAEIEINTLLAGLNRNLDNSELVVLQHLRTIDLSPNGAAPSGVARTFRGYIDDWRMLITRRGDAQSIEIHRRLAQMEREITALKNARRGTLDAFDIYDEWT